MNDSTKKILEKLERQCARREYCRSDILSKALKCLDNDKEAAMEVTDALVSEGYVNDLRYASAFAREKSGLTGWGPLKIRMALCAKHIGKDIIDSALEEIDGDKAEAKLRKLLETKWKSLDGDPQAKLKLLRFALGRGYDYDGVKEIVDDICRG